MSFRRPVQRTELTGANVNLLSSRGHMPLSVLSLTSHCTVCLAFVSSHRKDRANSTAYFFLAYCKLGLRVRIPLRTWMYVLILSVRPLSGIV